MKHHDIDFPYLYRMVALALLLGAILFCCGTCSVFTVL